MIRWQSDLQNEVYFLFVISLSQKQKKKGQEGEGFKYLRNGALLSERRLSCPLHNATSYEGMLQNYCNYLILYYKIH